MCIRDSLKGADLTGADLSGADLSSSDLSGANLSGVDLTGTDLTGALWTNIQSQAAYDAIVAVRDSMYTQEQYDARYSQDQYDTRYNVGYDSGYYSGVNSVTTSPNTYGFYSAEEYSENYSLGYETAMSVGASEVTFLLDTDAKTISFTGSAVITPSSDNAGMYLYTLVNGTDISAPTVIDISSGLDGYPDDLTDAYDSQVSLMVRDNSVSFFISTLSDDTGDDSGTDTSDPYDDYLSGGSTVSDPYADLYGDPYGGTTDSGATSSGTYTLIGNGTEISYAGLDAVKQAQIESLVTLGTNEISSVGSPSQMRRLYTSSDYTTQYDTGVVLGRTQITGNPSSNSLYTASDMVELTIGNPALSRQSDGSFKLSFNISQVADILSFTTEDLIGLSPTINTDGKIELPFTSSDGSPFYKLQFGTNDE